jgi:hypothetical protein
MKFSFSYEQIIPIWSPPNIVLKLGFEVSATVEFALVLDSKGIREAIEQNKPLKALNSLGIRDIIDGRDPPIITIRITVYAAIEVSAVIVSIELKGGVDFDVFIDIYNPYPEREDGIVRPFELFAIRYGQIFSMHITRPNCCHGQISHFLTHFFPFSCCLILSSLIPFDWFEVQLIITVFIELTIKAGVNVPLIG